MLGMLSSLRLPLYDTRSREETLSSWAADCTHQWYDLYRQDKIAMWHGTNKPPVPDFRHHPTTSSHAQQQRPSRRLQHGLELPPNGWVHAVERRRQSGAVRARRRLQLLLAKGRELECVHRVTLVQRAPPV